MADSEADARFIIAMNISQLPFPDEVMETSREVVLFTKTANGKVIGQPLSFNHLITRDPREMKCSIKQVLADSLEPCSIDEIVLDNIYYITKQSKASSLFLIVNNSGMEQVLVEYLSRIKNGHESSVPIHLAVDWHFRGQFVHFSLCSIARFTTIPICDKWSLV